MQQGDSECPSSFDFIIIFNPKCKKKENLLREISIYINSYVDVAKTKQNSV